jgi:uroporphyrinogen-III synthase
MTSGRGESPLAGRRILVTRPGSRGAELTRRLCARGARAEQRPTIRLDALRDDSAARSVVSRLREYDWILFTSSNGVRFFFDLLEACGTRSGEPIPAAASIGPATSQALRRRGVEPALEASDSRAEGLAAALEDAVRAGQTVLLVRPESARDYLPRALAARGVRIDPVAFYRNVPAPGLDDLARDLCAGEFDAVVFSAPSTADHLLAEAEQIGLDLRDALARAALVAIGEVTADALRAAGLAVDAVAEKPTDAAIAEALERALRG